MAMRSMRGSLVLGLALTIVEYSCAQQAPANTKVREAQRVTGLQLMSLPSIDCKADAASVAPGETAVVRAHGTSPEGRELRYSFAANAGQVVTKGDVAEIRTAGLGPRAVQVTCSVTDAQGRAATKTITVTIRDSQVTEIYRKHEPITALPKPAPLPSQIESATLPSTVAVAPKPITVPTHVESASPPPPPPPPPPVPAPEPAKTNQTTPAPVAGKGEIADQKRTEPVLESGTASATGQTVDDKGSGAKVDGYEKAKSVADWKKRLKVGKIEYQVPSQMLMQHASTVTVVIHGYGDVATTTLPQATGSGTLKQSERMKVELFAPDNPGEFMIVPEGADAVRFVPIDGATTWMWNVTPNAPAQRQRLMIRASVIYPAGDDKTEQQLPDYWAIVEVDVPSYWAMIRDNYQKDPLKWFSYVIPGGAGFTFATGFLVWWWKRKKEVKEKV